MGLPASAGARHTKASRAAILEALRRHRSEWVPAPWDCSPVSERACLSTAIASPPPSPATSRVVEEFLISSRDFSYIRTTRAAAIRRGAESRAALRELQGSAGRYRDHPVAGRTRQARAARRQPDRRAAQGPRSIPAGAGAMRSRPRPTSHTPEHPRGCGGDRGEDGGRRAQCGASPRVRGRCLVGWGFIGWGGCFRLVVFWGGPRGSGRRSRPVASGRGPRCGRPTPVRWPLVR